MSEHVKGFGSFEEMTAYMAEREQQANEALHPAQAELRDDTEQTRYWVRPEASLDVLVFGEAWSTEQALASSMKYVTEKPGTPEYDESLAEAEYEIETQRESRTRGYVYGWCYSVYEPNGELGSTHVANVWPISQQAFEEAKRAGWRAVISEVPGMSTPKLVEELRALDAERKKYREDHS